MVAGGADFGSFCTDNDVSTVAAFPYLHLTFGKDGSGLYILQQRTIALFVVTSDFGYEAELFSKSGKPSSSAVFAKPSYMSVHS